MSKKVLKDSKFKIEAAFLFGSMAGDDFLESRYILLRKQRDCGEKKEIGIVRKALEGIKAL